MAVSTRVMTFDRQFQPLSDGASTVFVQVKSGVMEYVVADAPPPDDAEGHTEGGVGFTITPPTVMWGRSATNQVCRVAMSPSE